MRIILRIFLLLSLALLVPKFSAQAATPSMATMKLSIVSAGGMVFYQVGRSPVIEGQLYDAYYSGRKIGTFQVTRVEINYATAKILQGEFIWYEGYYLDITPSGFEKSDFVPVPGSVKPVGEETRDDSYVPPTVVYKPVEKSAPSRIKPIEGYEEKSDTRETDKKKPEKKEKETSKDTKEKEKSDKKETSSSRREKTTKKKEKKEEPVEIETTSSKKQPAPRIPAPTSPAWVATLVSRVETHTSSSYESSSITEMLTASTKRNNDIWSIFVMYNNGREIEGDSTFRYGLSWARFLDKKTYITAGYSRSDDDNQSDPYYLSFNKLIPQSRRNSYFRFQVSYTKDSDSVNDSNSEFYTGSLMYHALSGKKNSVELGYRYTYSADSSEHVYDWYTLDYKIPAGNKRKLSIGYRLIDPVYDPLGIAERDEIFQLTYYYSGIDI